MIILFAILLFSLLVVVHELGHFITAKLSGVQVNEFSIFMGPAIFKKQVGETLYALRCIPFGGYCAMEGEDGDSENPRAFTSVAWWKRLLILVAGSFMNFVAGLVLLAVVVAPAEQILMPEVDSYESWSTIFHENGLQQGDRFLEVDGEKIYVASDFSLILSLNPGDVHDLVVERNGQKVYLEDFLMEKHPVENEDGTVSYLYGFTFAYAPATLGQKIGYVWNSAIDYIRTVRLSLKMLVSGQAGISDMSGPVGIVQQMSQTAQSAQSTQAAIMTLVSYGAMIAVNLAVMNLLPLPALDGGRAFCLLITVAAEKITGKKVDAKYEAYLHGAGMILLLGLIAVITFKDILGLFKG